MVEISEWLWETIYVMKQVYDHNPDAPLLRMYRDSVLDGECVYEISQNAVDQFFADTRGYYDSDKDLSIYVFFDPIITEYWKLCDEYEERTGLKPEDNRFREAMDRALSSALSIPDYSYNAVWYSDTKRKNGCRLVLLCYCEFYGYHWIPGALGEAYDTFVYQTNRIKEALAELEKPKIVELPKRKRQRKKAA